jgi:hypothetical protein
MAQVSHFRVKTEIAQVEPKKCFNKCVHLNLTNKYNNTVAIFIRSGIKVLQNKAFG